MIICICSNVTERQALELRHLPIDQVMLKTGAAMCCGCCFEILERTLGDAAAGDAADKQPKGQT